jgi:dihydroxy-acid dehydratase
MKNILNEKAIHNAFVVDMAMGGSSNTVLHLLAIARESDIEYKIENINKIADKVAHISKISPSRPDVHMDDVNKAGGVNAVMCEVSKRGNNLNLDALMISG